MPKTVVVHSVCKMSKLSCNRPYLLPKMRGRGKTIFDGPPTFRGPCERIQGTELYLYLVFSQPSGKQSGDDNPIVEWCPMHLTHIVHHEMCAPNLHSIDDLN